MTNKIYAFANGDWAGDYLGVGMAEDGAVLASHVSSSETWLAHDLGATSQCEHERYAAHYPDGFEVEYVPLVELSSHAGLLAAVKANQAQAAEQEKGGAP